IGIVVCFAALNALESITAPMALALITGVVLSPLSDFWEQRGYSPVVGALVGMVTTLVVLAGFILILQPMISQLVETAPKVWADMQDVVVLVQKLIRGLSDVKDEMQNAVVPEAKAATEAAAPDVLPSLSEALMIAPAVVSQILVFSGVLFFFLMSRRDIYDWVALHLSGKGNRAHMALTLRRAERSVARYFLTITLINFALGAATGTVLQILGMPGAAMWGLLAFFLNFVVYLGPFTFAVVMLFAGVGAFDGGQALLPALSFLVLNTIEGQFVTPALVGRHMQLNPLLVFLSLIFGIWLWGPIGGIVAIPLLLWVVVLSAGPEGAQTAAKAA
ncbi:AI-2E family transporter, partial [Pseudorhodobacter sp.]|uniref:AI-2E family transporter n=1 Tax=Pseudorhodobacter sp. TaxID=1934400 RepID=UPI00264930DD